MGRMAVARLRARSGRAAATVVYRPPAAKPATTAATTTRTRSARVLVVPVVRRCHPAGTACSRLLTSRATTARPTVTRPTMAAPRIASTGRTAVTVRRIRASRATTARPTAPTRRTPAVAATIANPHPTAVTANATVRNNVTWAAPRTPAPTALATPTAPWHHAAATRKSKPLRSATTGRRAA